MLRSVYRYLVAAAVSAAIGLFICMVLAWSGAVASCPSDAATQAIETIRAHYGHLDVSGEAIWMRYRLTFLGHLAWLLEHGWYLFSLPIATGVALTNWSERRNARPAPAMDSDRKPPIPAVICDTALLLWGALLVLGATIAMTKEDLLFISGFVFHIYQDLGLLVWAFPVTLVSVFAIFASLRNRPKRVVRHHLLSLIPLTIPLVTAGWGAFFWRQGMPGWSEDELPVQMLGYLVLAQLALSIGLVWIYRGNRLFFSAIFVFGLLVGLGMNFIATMATRNCWL